MPEKIRILIVDDHAMVRAGLRRVIETEPAMAVVGEAESIASAVELASTMQPDIITLDLSLPGSTGLQSMQRLRQAAPKAKIIVMTLHDDPAYARSAAAFGASAFVPKTAADTELISAIRSVARGRSMITVDAEGRVGNVATRPSTSDERPIAPVEELSPREREVLAAAAHGYSNQQIADQLALSVKSVESYRARLMHKLDLHDRADLVRIAIDLGMFASPPLP